MPETPQTVGLLLIPGFALMSYASVVEPLRAANLLAGRELYRWVHITPGPAIVTASCGATVPCPEKAGDTVKLDFLFVCAGGNPTAFKDRTTLQWLRTLAARGLRIGGVSGGPVILARAGIMDGYHMTVHWEHAPAVSEGFPNIMLTRSIYIVDRNRLTCAGGTAPLDMMHALIAEAHGPELARKVSDWFMHTDIRPAQSAQRASLTERYGVHDGKPPRRAADKARNGAAHRAFDAPARPVVRREARLQLCRALPQDQARTRPRPAAPVRRADHRNRTGVRILQRQPFQPGISRGVRRDAGVGAQGARSKGKARRNFLSRALSFAWIA